MHAAASGSLPIEVSHHCSSSMVTALSLACFVAAPTVHHLVLCVRLPSLTSDLLPLTSPPLSSYLDSKPLHTRSSPISTVHLMSPWVSYSPWGCFFSKHWHGPLYPQITSIQITPNDLGTVLVPAGVILPGTFCLLSRRFLVGEAKSSTPLE